jgi:DNA-binding NarL/FixJ family response regulator
MAAGIRKMNYLDPEKVVELFRMGLNRSQIAQRLGCSPGTVSPILTKHGLTSPQTQRHQYDGEGALAMTSRRSSGTTAWRRT